MMGIHFNLP